MTQTTSESLKTLQDFTSYIRDNNIMKQEDIVRTVRTLVQLDRRIGTLGVTLGFFKPEDINRILNEQLKSDLMFGEAAIKLKIITKEKLDEIYKRQKDEIYLFTRAAITSGAVKAKEMLPFVRKYYKEKAKDKTSSLTSPVPDKKTRALLNSIKEVAPLPQTVQKVLDMLRDPDVKMQEVSNVIQIDPVLTAQFLKVVNSASYGLRSKINTVSQAMVLLGLTNIKHLLLTAGILKKFTKIPKKKGQVFWDNSVKVAQWSKMIAESLEFENLEEIFTAGLLHNLGKLVILQYYQEQVNEIEKSGHDNISKAQAERKLLGMDHADIAAFVFEIWQMNPEIIQGAMYHRLSLGELKELKNHTPAALIINLAVRLSDLKDNPDKKGFAVEIKSIIDEYKEFIQVDKLDIELLIDKVNESVSALKRLLAS